MIAVLVITDGRDDYLAECIASMDQLHGPISERWMFDDTGNDAYRRALADQYPEWTQINAGGRQGGAGAIRESWKILREFSGADFVFHVEGDFTFPRPIDLSAMIRLLELRPDLVQVALRRQPWNEGEMAAGGIVEQHPDAYADMVGGDLSWLEHGLFWTTNPCLYRWDLLAFGWPDSRRGVYSETTFHQRLGEAGSPPNRYAYWGARDSGVWVQHIGYRRVGSGY